MILQDCSVVTNIEAHRGVPVMRPIWEKLTEYDLTPEVRDFSWQISHGAINTKNK